MYLHLFIDIFIPYCYRGEKEAKLPEKLLKESKKIKQEIEKEKKRMDRGLQKEKGQTVGVIFLILLKLFIIYLFIFTPWWTQTHRVFIPKGRV